jgi:Tfp pilus assembly protein PilO
MNKEQWHHLIGRLKSPATILFLVIIVGCLINGYIVVRDVLPPSKQHITLQLQLSKVEQEKKRIQQRPIPKKVEENEIQQALYQVPTKEELPRLILGIKELEQQVGLSILSIKFGDQEPASSSADSLINAKGQANITQGYSTNSNGVQQTAPSASPTAGATLQTQTQTVIMEESFTIQASGTYPQIIEFINKVQHSERFIAIQKWNWQTAAVNSSKTEQTDISNVVSLVNSTTSEQTDVQGKMLQVNLECSFYYAPSLVGKLKELPSLPVNEPSKRSNPVQSDEEYFKQLQQLQATKPTN